MLEPNIYYRSCSRGFDRGSTERWGSLSGGRAVTRTVSLSVGFQQCGDWSSLTGGLRFNRLRYSEYPFLLAALCY